jgi:hypothetical protein
MWLVYSCSHPEGEFRAMMPERLIRTIANGGGGGPVAYVEGMGEVHMDRFAWASNASAAAAFVRLGWDAMIHPDGYCEACGKSRAPDLEDEAERTCRVCGCTDDDCSQCIEATGEACSWVSEDLCSRCEQEGEGLEDLSEDELDAALKYMKWRHGGGTPSPTSDKRKPGDEWETPSGRKLRYVEHLDDIGPCLAVLDVEAGKIIATRDATCHAQDWVRPGEPTMPPLEVSPEEFGNALHSAAYQGPKWKYTVRQVEGKWHAWTQVDGEWTRCKHNLGKDYASCQEAVDAILAWAPDQVELINIPANCGHDQAHALASKPPEPTSQA